MADQTCKTCGGQGMIPCEGCNGSGQQRDKDSGARKSWSSCARCNGRGQVRCPTCHGSGSTGSAK